MKRRRALACVGSALFAGCLSESTFGGSDPTASTTRTTATTTEHPHPTTGTETHASPTLEIPAENHCPSFGDSRVICSVDADAGTTLRMVPSKETANLPKSTLSFALKNETGATFTTNYYAWSLWKRADGKWFRIAPRAIPQPAMMLESGDSHAWTVTVDNTDLGSALDRAGGTETLAFAGLGGGTYAFGIDGWFEGDSYQNSIGVAARFELVGDELELTPTNDLEVVGRNGDEKHVRVGNGGKTFVATRIENTEEDPRRVLPEEAIRVTPLRNLLASFEPGVRRVILDEKRRSIFLSEPQVIEYAGETFRIEPVDE